MMTIVKTSYCPCCLCSFPGSTPPILPGCLPYHPSQPKPYAEFLMDSACDVSTTCCAIPAHWRSFALLSCEPLNHDASVFRFALDSPTAQLNLPPASYFLIQAPNAEHGGGPAIRAYTSVSPPDAQGYFEICVKHYRQWGDPKFPHSFKPAGAVSSRVHRLEPILFKHVPAKHQRPASIFDAHKFTLVAVGAGAAAMVNVVRYLQSLGTKHVVLLLGNRSVRDILFKDWFLSRQHHSSFKPVFVVGSRWAKIHMHLIDCPPKCKLVHDPPPPLDFDSLPESSRELGWIDERVLAKHAFAPAPDAKVFVCGLPSIYDALCGPRDEIKVSGALARLGYGDSMVVKF